MNEGSGGVGKMIWIAPGLAALGLLLAAVGAVHASRGSILTEEEAVEIGVSRLSGQTHAENLELPAVQALLRQSKATKVGVIWIVLGTGFQVLATILAIVQTN